MIMMYFMHIIRLPVDCIYKKVFIIRYCYYMYRTKGSNHGPTMRFLDICKKYELLSVVKQAVEECVIPSKYEWKKIVEEKIWANENKQWKLQSTLYVKLNGLKEMMPKIAPLSWWFYVQTNSGDLKKCRMIVRLLLGVHNLKSNRYKIDKENVRDPYCEHCNYRSPENVSHVLFECSENDHLRVKLWQAVRETCPNTLNCEIESMSTDTKTSFLLTGLGNGFIKEWQATFKAIVDFIYVLYMSRLAMNK